MEPKTKKMPVSLSFGSFKTKANEFLVPIFKKTEIIGFMGISSGKIYPYGAISYIGRSITSKDIINRITNLYPNSISSALLDKYLIELQSFKIGNVIKIEYLENGDFKLIKVSNRPTIEKKPKLP